MCWDAFKTYSALIEFENFPSALSVSLNIKNVYFVLS